MKDPSDGGDPVDRAVARSAAGTEPPSRTDGDRRAFLATASSLAMGGGLVAGYGAFGAVSARFLYPEAGSPRGWMYVARLADLRAGDSFEYTAPDGAAIAIARTASTGKAEDFLALSSTCPHLGCRVHWEGANRRFFCPCHNGVFDPSGRATSGPPADAGQDLSRYPLRVEDGLLYILVPLSSVAAAVGDEEDSSASSPAGGLHASNRRTETDAV